MLEFATIKHYLEPVFYLSDPDRRVFVAYLLASLGLAVFVLYREAKPIKSSIHVAGFKTDHL